MIAPVDSFQYAIVKQKYPWVSVIPLAIIQYIVLHIINYPFIGFTCSLFPATNSNINWKYLFIVGDCNNTVYNILSTSHMKPHILRTSRDNPLLTVMYYILGCLLLYRMEVTPISKSDFDEIIACSSQYESSVCCVQLFNIHVHQFHQ